LVSPHADEGWWLVLQARHDLALAKQAIEDQLAKIEPHSWAA
jgi:hypothetical protein